MPLTCVRGIFKRCGRYRNSRKSGVLPWKPNFSTFSVHNPEFFKIKMPCNYL